MPAYQLGIAWPKEPVPCRKATWVPCGALGLVPVKRCRCPPHPSCPEGPAGTGRIILVAVAEGGGLETGIGDHTAGRVKVTASISAALSPPALSTPLRVTV